ncbi:MAG: acyl-CoA dehydratase activase-related protein, partial [Spirochaetales bacterium]|nr:acyl-CoA dehydratase activase-related protein [Spirochaetales bacterium]
MQSLGINIGSSSLKIVLLEDSEIVWNEVVLHEGNFYAAVEQILNSHNIPHSIKALVTGTEGRFLFNINNVIEPLCIEAALNRIDEKVDAVVTMGGEDLIVYTIDSNNRIVNNFSGSKCASGTGEFFKQQLGRMDMSLEDVEFVPDSSKVHPLSARCSVFMKSDCTHKLNKNEATKEDIVVSLSDVMATKVIDFLKRAKIEKGNVLLTGGTTKNRHIVRFIKQKTPLINFIIPEEAPYFEAYGAAFLAQESGSVLPAVQDLMKINKIRFDSYDDLKKVTDLVTYFESSTGKVRAGHEYILGIDGGSTTTKACLIDIETDEIVASHYGRTHGDPIKSLKTCLIEIKKKIREDIGDEEINISLSSTTGSSREILGVFIESPGVYNEIIAHAVGTTYFDEEVDTIFEIGGQDAKYVLLKNKVPIDYAMNEACSAGTGSFLEESAHGDLNIQHAFEIADIALSSESALKFGEHCSAFINSDIRKAIQQGATRESITGGIVTSIVSNYLNRVVGNRTLGKKIFLQGGVAKNRAVPLAFALLLDKQILVPPSPELMGAFGVGLLAKEKFSTGLLEKSSFNLDRLISQEIVYERVFTCKSCENNCPIQVLNVNNHKYMFGGRCSKYTNTKSNADPTLEVFDYVKKRSDLLFVECAPKERDFLPKYDFTVGIPRAFSVHTMYPLYSWFFHALGIKTILSDTIAHEGVARVESSYCYPAEIAHGAVQDIWNKGCDYIFIPHFRDMDSYEKDVHANFCPITQALPYYIKKAFPDIPEEKILALVVSFKFGKAKAMEYFVQMGGQMNIPQEEIEAAFNIAFEKQNEYFQKASDMGKAALVEARKAERPVIALLGRPYNAFTKEANMGIP